MFVQRNSKKMIIIIVRLFLYIATDYWTLLAFSHCVFFCTLSECITFYLKVMSGWM